MKFTKWSLLGLVGALVLVAPTAVFLAIEGTTFFVTTFIITACMALAFFVMTLFSWRMSDEHKERMGKGLERKKWNERRKTEKIWIVLFCVFTVGMSIPSMVSAIIFLL